MSCRDEVLEMVRTLTAHRSPKTFTIQEVIDGLRDKGTKYSENTIRTHVSSRMCVTAPPHHKSRYRDFQWVSRGLYKVI